MRNGACPKCQGAMQQGLVLTDTHGGGKSPGQWAEGPLVRSWVWGLKLRTKPVDIVAYSCRRCGFIEHYAQV